MSSDRIASHLCRAINAIVRRRSRPLSVPLKLLGYLNACFGPNFADQLCLRLRRTIPRQNVELPTPISSLLSRENNFTLPRETLRYLYDTLLARRPVHVCEFGSGLSTVVLAHYLRESNLPGRVVSFEHNATYAEATKSLLHEFGLHTFSTILPYPDALPTFVERTGDKIIDFVLVDGPPRSLGRGRIHTCPYLRTVIKRNGILLMDDAFRDHERMCIEEWHRDGIIRKPRLVLIPHGLVTAVFTGC